MAEVKIKLKEGVKLSSNDNFSGLDNMSVWTALNQGKEVSLEENKIPKLIKEKITIKAGLSAPVKKGGK